MSLQMNDAVYLHPNESCHVEIADDSFVESNRVDVVPADSSEPNRVDDIAVGDKLEVETGAGTEVLSYHGKNNDGNHIFSTPTTLLDFDENKTRYLLSHGKIRRGNLKIDSKKTSTKLIKETNTHFVSQLLLSNRHETADDDACHRSVQSVPVSEEAHKQSGMTCYAIACATAIRTVEARIIGRNPESFQDLLGAIVDKYGNDGGHVATVLNDFCQKKSLGYRALQGQEQILASLKAGRVVVASFYLPAYQWHLFSAFFKQNPAGILTKAHFDLDSRRETDFPPELRKIGGHAVVISGYDDRRGRKLFYKIKNSWGADFADNGYFQLAADALTLYECFDVHFRVDMLTSVDIRNYLTHLLRTNAFVQQEGAECIKLPWCDSCFELVEATREVHDFSAAEQGIVTMIQSILSKDDHVKVGESGTIAVRYSKYRFCVFVAGRAAREPTRTASSEDEHKFWVLFFLIVSLIFQMTRKW